MRSVANVTKMKKVPPAFRSRRRRDDGDEDERGKKKVKWKERERKLMFYIRSTFCRHSYSRYIQEFFFWSLWLRHRKLHVLMKKIQFL